MALEVHKSAAVEFVEVVEEVVAGAVGERMHCIAEAHVADWSFQLPSRDLLGNMRMNYVQNLAVADLLVNHIRRLRVLVGSNRCFVVDGPSVLVEPDIDSEEENSFEEA